MVYIQKYSNQVLSPIGALLLLLVFLAPTLTEAFHQHSCYSGKTAVKKVKTPEGEHYDTSHPKCKVCELIKHQSDNGPVSAQLTLSLSQLVVQIAGFDNLRKANLGFILSSSNKGPPGPSC